MPAISSPPHDWGALVVVAQSAAADTAWSVLGAAGELLLGLAVLAIAAVVAFVLTVRGESSKAWIAWTAVAVLGLCRVAALTATLGWSPEFLGDPGVLKLVAAIVAWGAVAALLSLVPDVLALQSPEAVAREVAGRKKAEQAMRDSAALFSSLIETLPLNVFRKDCAGRVQMLNQRYCDTLGMSREDVIGKTDYELFPHELAAKYRRDDERVMVSGEILEAIEEHTRPDGTRLFVQVLKAPVHDAQGHCIGIQGMFWDVTERKQTEEMLRASDARFRRLVESSLIGVMTANLDGRVLDANNAFLKMIGYSREDVAAGHLRWDRITPHEHRPLDEWAIEHLLETGDATPWEKEFIRQDGTRVPVLIGVTMLEQSREECICFVLDITDRKRTLEELREAKERADAASLAKSQFLANMSHEVRTPMNAIVGLTELVLASPLRDQQREYLELVLESAESLLGVLNDVLDFSKIEVGRLDLERTAFDLRDSLGDTMKSLAVRARGKSLELVCDVAPDVPDKLQGDALRLRQIVVNLVGNAIKFTERGEVVLRVQIDEVGAGGNDQKVHLHFLVRDTGEGIPLEKQETIFEPFEQADASTTRRHGGTGLGLAICVKLVDLMGGSIWVESEPGLGSTFHFVVPFGVVPAATEPHDPLPESCVGLRALVAVENAACRRMLHDALESWRLSVATTAAGETALELLADAHRDGHPFHLFVTDLHLPDGEGFRFVERLRNEPAIADTPSILLARAERAGDASRCDELGIAARLFKPVKYSALRQAVATALDLHDPLTAAPAADAGSQLPNVGPLRILLAEDSLVNQTVAVGILRDAGHQVVVATTGKQAVELATREEFDLVLMDVQMPELDGLEATRAIRIAERGVGRHVPILAMTAHAMRGDRERCLAAGMDDYLTKPVRARRLHEKIAALLAAQGKTATVARPPADPPAAEAAEAEEAAGPRVATLAPGPAARDAGESGLHEPAQLNWQAALKAVGSKPRLLREVVEAFLVQTPPLLRDLRSAVLTGDRAGAHRHAHTIKGSLRFFGPTAAADLAAGIERAAGQESFSALGLRIDALELALRPVTLALEHHLQTAASQATLKPSGAER